MNTTILRSSVLLLCTALCSLTTSAQEYKKDTIVTYRGNKIAYGQRIDTVHVVDPADGHQIIKIIHHDPAPVKLNGVKIYDADQVTITPMARKENIQVFLIRSLYPELGKLPNGIFYLDLFDVVFDSKGNIAYYRYGGILSKDNKIKIPEGIKASTSRKVDSIINKVPPYSPGQLKGKPINVRATDMLYDTYKIKVKNHKVNIDR